MGELEIMRTGPNMASPKRPSLVFVTDGDFAAMYRESDFAGMTMDDVQDQFAQAKRTNEIQSPMRGCGSI